MLTRPRAFRGSLRMGACLVLAAVAAGCGDGGPAPASSTPPRIYTTFFPTTYFVQRIAGEHAEIVCPLPADADPIFWMPDAAALQAYQQADLIVINGAGFEKWIAKVSLPPSKVVDTAAVFEKQFITYEQAVTHSHGPGEHSHEGLDGHTWLDPQLAKIQADQVRSVLARLLPDQAQDFRANFTMLAADLDELHALLVELSAALGDRPLLTSHPAYNYLVKRYDWNVVNFSLDPEAVPDDETAAEIKAALKDKPARLLLWEAEPAKDVADWFDKELGLAGVVFSPCETLGAAEAAGGSDYVEAMQANVQRLRAAIESVELTR